MNAQTLTIPIINLNSEKDVELINKLLSEIENLDEYTVNLDAKTINVSAKNYGKFPLKSMKL